MSDARHTQSVLCPVIEAQLSGGFMYGCYMLSHMEPDTVVPTEVAADAEVMAAVEDGPVDQFIVADVTKDDAYITLPLDDAASLPAWR